LLEVCHDAPPATGDALRALFDTRWGMRRGPLASGVWRFREAVLPTAGDDVVTYPEGNTPLSTRPQISAWAGLGAGDFLLKQEGQNPTGSFKDRGMTVGVTQACRVGAAAVACASTGNTGASLAAYAALAGLPALVIVPKAHVTMGKLAQALAYGARTLLVRGDFDRCLELAEQASERLGVYLLNSINPFRLEGQKTIVLELLQQLSWEAPEWIVVPAGNLGNTAAFGKALGEARAWGLIDRVPRLVAVQAEGAAPFALSFREGFARRHRVEARTVASAIAIGNPASYERAVLAIRETNGVVTTVTDDEILEAKAVVDAAGIGCEPASAAAVAGTRQLVRNGTIRSGDRVVGILTGHVLKDPAIVTRYHQEIDPPPARANRPVEIEPELGAVERAMRAG
jgi:threonine synthase